MKNFTIDADGAVFEFHTMNIKDLRLFQVYVVHEGIRKRFHMQVTGSGDFKITDLVSCPEEYHKTEKQLSDAIMIYGKA